MEEERYESVQRVYGSLRWYVGNNWTFHRNDILYVSSKNDTIYDYILVADGKRTFLELWKDRDNHLDDIEEIKAFLAGFSGNRTLLEILRGYIRKEERQEQDGTTLLNIIVDPLNDV